MRSPMLALLLSLLGAVAANAAEPGLPAFFEKH